MEVIENEGELRFGAFLEQIEKCVEQGFYYVAIMACLTIPDIAGAIDSDTWEATKSQYKDWFDEYAAQKYQSFGEHHLTGEICYFLRCSMLHQGTVQHKEVKKKYADILFCQFPQVQSSVNPLFMTEDEVLLIEPKTFCTNMVYAAYDWLEKVHHNELFQKNTQRFISLFSLSFPELPN